MAVREVPPHTGNQSWTDLLPVRVGLWYRSVVGDAAGNPATTGRFRVARAVDPAPLRVQAATSGPLAQPLDRFGGGQRHGHHVLSRLGQRYIQ